MLIARNVEQCNHLAFCLVTKMYAPLAKRCGLCRLNRMCSTCLARVDFFQDLVFWAWLYFTDFLGLLLSFWVYSVAPVVFSPCWNCTFCLIHFPTLQVQLWKGSVVVCLTLMHMTRVNSSRAIFHNEPFILDLASVLEPKISIYVVVHVGRQLCLLQF